MILYKGGASAIRPRPQSSRHRTYQSIPLCGASGPDINPVYSRDDYLLSYFVNLAFLCYNRQDSYINLPRFVLELYFNTIVMNY